MDPIVLPEDLTAADAAALAELDTAIRARADELLALDNPSDADVEELETLAGHLTTLAGETARREGETAARAERIEAVRNALTPADETTDADGETIDAPVSEAATETDAAVDETVEQIPVAAAAETTTASVAATEAAATTPSRPTPGSLASRRPKVATPTPAATRRGLARASNLIRPVDGIRPGDDVDRAQLATLISEKFEREMKGRQVPAGLREQMTMAGFEKKGLTLIDRDEVANYGPIKEARRHAEGLVAAALTPGSPEHGLVASGAFCSPLPPNYDIFRSGEVQTPVEDSLATVQGPRGGIRVVQGGCFVDDAASGVGVFAHDHNYVSTQKECVTITCPNVSDIYVSAVSQCLTVDNLKYRAAPELVETWLADLDVAFADRKERFFLDYMSSTSTAVTASTPAYGLSRQVIHDVATAAIAYRKRNNMRADSPVVWYAQDWVKVAVALDIAMGNSRDWQSVTDAEIAEGFARFGIVPVWVNASLTATVEGASATAQRFGTAQSSGPLLGWPTTAVTFLHAPGSYIHVDGGTLDVGLVRDSTLNSTNDLQLFEEEYHAIAFVGCESIRLTLTSLCPDGTAPALATAHACGATL